MLPNFIIGGTPAGGTSFLGAAIAQHPEIYLPYPMEPECHFFYKSWEYEQGLEYYQRKWFADVDGERAVGERSSSYLFGGATVAERISAALPDVKLIFTLRNPIERAWGNYRFTVLQGLEELPFLEALKREPERIAAQTGRWAEIQPHNYTGRGMYAGLLTQYLARFQQTQVLLVKSEEMGQDPQRTFVDVFRFLGVTEDFQPCIPANFSALSVKDPAEQVRVRAVFGQKITPILEAIRREEDPSHFACTDEERAMMEILKANVEGSKRPMPAAARAILRDTYSEDLDLLEEIVPFSIEDWKR
ncbi:MAG: sulfotransferase domain-containing protein [Alphaproteobacteria bacterium]|nr:sulfotransferase domain-containing protein [Alphaproteobacteria bacterium]